LNEEKKKFYLGAQFRLQRSYGKPLHYTVLYNILYRQHLQTGLWDGILHIHGCNAEVSNLLGK